tara:strand:- start:17786 stop:18220 length:435 start_codon:yes stop_codon:yes gene_type:complete
MREAIILMRNLMAKIGSTQKKSSRSKITKTDVAIEHRNKETGGIYYNHSEAYVNPFEQHELELPSIGRDNLMPKEKVNHPDHYNAGKIEVIDAIEDWGLDFIEGNVVKYITRSKHKGNTLGDLKKARWYLDYRIAELNDNKRSQ